MLTCPAAAFEVIPWYSFFAKGPRFCAHHSTKSGTFRDRCLPTRLDARLKWPEKRTKGFFFERNAVDVSAGSRPPAQQIQHKVGDLSAGTYSGPVEHKPGDLSETHLHWPAQGSAARGRPPRGVRKEHKSGDHSAGCNSTNLGTFREHPAQSRGPFSTPAPPGAQTRGPFATWAAPTQNSACAIRCRASDGVDTWSTNLGTFHDLAVRRTLSAQDQKCSRCKRACDSRTTARSRSSAHIQRPFSTKLGTFRSTPETFQHKPRDLSAQTQGPQCR